MKSRSIRKGVWLSAAFALSLGAVAAGCAKSEKEPAGSAEPKETKEAKESKEPAKKGKITVSIYDRGNVPAEEGTPAKNRWTDWINANAPVEVSFVSVPRNEEDQKYNTLFASGGAPDLIFTWTPAIVNKLYSQKQLLPLNDLIESNSTEYKNILNKYPVLKKMGTKSDGKLYALGAIAPLDVGTGMFVRADWLKKLNLEVPKTTEDLYKVIQAFSKQDPDGNGKADTYGYHLSSVGGQNIDNMFGAGAGWYIEKDEYIHDWNRAIAAVAFKKRLYDDGLVDKDYLTDKNGEKAKQDFVNGRLGIYGVNNIPGAPGLSIYQTLKQNQPNAEIIAIPLPKSEFGQFSPYVSPPYYLSAVINSQAKDPKAVMQYIDFLLKESTANTLKYGIEGTHWKADANGCPAPIDADKNKKEVDWAYDFSMLDQPITAAKCSDYMNQLNPDKPVEKEYMAIIKQAREAYLSPERPVFHDIDFSSITDLPKEMQLNRNNSMTAVIETYAKAIVGGASYPIEKALADAKAAWEKGGGKEADEYLAKWYTESKANLVYSKDYYAAK